MSLQIQVRRGDSISVPTLAAGELGFSTDTNEIVVGNPNNPPNQAVIVGSRLHKAIINPIVTNDSNSGFAVGSKWINTLSDELYICLDNTLGAAIWAQISTTSASPDTVDFEYGAITSTTDNGGDLTKSRTGASATDDYTYTLANFSGPGYIAADVRGFFIECSVIAEQSGYEEASVQAQFPDSTYHNLLKCWIDSGGNDDDQREIITAFVPINPSQTDLDLRLYNFSNQDEAEFTIKGVLQKTTATAGILGLDLVHIEPVIIGTGNSNETAWTTYDPTPYISSDATSILLSCTLKQNHPNGDLNTGSFQWDREKRLLYRRDAVIAFEYQINRIAATSSGDEIANFNQGIYPLADDHTFQWKIEGKYSGRQHYEFKLIGYIRKREVAGYDVAILRDQRVSGTNGGTFVAGAWQTRTLNAEVADPSGHVALAANKFTLNPGSYHITSYVPAYQVNGHKARLRNISDGTTAGEGTAGYCKAGVGVSESNNISIISAYITISTQKIFEIQHWCNTSNSLGYGKATNIAGESEIYTVVEIMKIG